MPVNNVKVRYFFAFLFGFTIAIFGVFIYSDFMYRGLRLEEDIFPNFVSGSFNVFWAGIYHLVGSGFQANLFSEFSLSNIQTMTLSAIIFGETVWPTILAWSSAGLVMGAMIKGGKRGFFGALLLFIGICIIYFVAAMFAGSNIAGLNFLTTLGELLTGFVCISISSLIGGFWSGPH
ncbi:MAG: hypothetical protein ACTSVZ_11055 [Promethearchaeota archaeon]